MEDSSKVVTFIDVGGNERYAKTLVRGLCVHFPDYALIVVDALDCAQKNCIIDKGVLDNFRIAFAF
jgi:GTPase